MNAQRRSDGRGQDPSASRVIRSWIIRVRSCARRRRVDDGASVAFAPGRCQVSPAGRGGILSGTTNRSFPLNYHWRQTRREHEIAGSHVMAMDYRLPTSVAPIRYDLRLEPDLVAATFTGEESITVTVG